MIKISGNILLFDKLDSLGLIFPKKCIVTLPAIIPIENFSSDIFAKDHIGAVDSCVIDKNGIAIAATIKPKIDEETVRKILAKEDVFFSGYYIVNKSHREGRNTVMDGVTLNTIRLCYDDVYGDKSLKVRVNK